MMYYNLLLKYMVNFLSSIPRHFHSCHTTHNGSVFHPNVLYCLSHRELRVIHRIISTLVMSGGSYESVFDLLGSCLADAKNLDFEVKILIDELMVAIDHNVPAVNRINTPHAPLTVLFDLDELAWFGIPHSRRKL